MSVAFLESWFLMDLCKCKYEGTTFGDRIGVDTGSGNGVLLCSRHLDHGILITSASVRLRKYNGLEYSVEDDTH